MTDQNNALKVQTPALPAYSEQNVSMVQQLAQAQIQSAYIMAERHPRDWDAAEQQILKECKRPQFCAIDPDPKKYGSSIAMYGVPRGGKFEGDKWVPNIVRDLTIRFAEMALPYIKNTSVDLWPMGEDDQQRVFRVVRIDYESNVTEGEIIIVPKTVERSKVKDGDMVVSQRTNSYGKPVYTLRATNEEMDQTKLVQYSKRKRNLVLSMLPGWLKEAAKAQILATQRTVDAKDPDAARRSLYAGFAEVGVSVEALKSYLGHSNDMSPAEVEDLRVLYAGIAGGHTTWKEIVAAKDGENEDEATTAAIEEAVKVLELTLAQERKTKAKYIGRDKDLLEWLTGEVAKKQNTGAKQEPSEPNPHHGKQATPTTPTDATSQANKTDGKTSSPQTEPENEDAEPLNGKQGSSHPEGGNFGTGTGPAPKQTGRPAPIPVSDDDEF